MSEFREETGDEIEEKLEETESIERQEEIVKEIPETITEEVEEKIFKLMFPKGKDVRYVFTALASLLHEANLVISPEGLKLKSIDPSKVSLIVLEIPSANLEEFQVPHEVKVGLIFDLIKNVAKRMKAREKVEFIIDRIKNRFYITIYSKKGREGGIYRKFGFPIISIAEEEIPEPSLTYPVRIKMNIDTFTDLVAAADEISDSISLIAKPDSLIIRAVGEGGKMLEAEYSRDDEVFYEFDVNEACEATYASEMILDFTRPMKQISETVTIEFSSNKPLRLTYEFSIGKVLFMLAPRVV